MELAVPYTKKRAEFGHHCEFDDVPTQILESIPSRCATAAESVFTQSARKRCG
jgi:hypothetical protein